MARKPSRIAQFGGWTAAAVIGWSLAGSSWAEDPPAAARAPLVIGNPYLSEQAEAAGPARQASPPDAGQQGGSQTTWPRQIYSPYGLSVRPGPLSRWQRSSSLSNRRAEGASYPASENPLARVQLSPDDMPALPRSGQSLADSLHQAAADLKASLNNEASDSQQPYDPFEELAGQVPLVTQEGAAARHSADTSSPKSPIVGIEEIDSPKEFYSAASMAAQRATTLEDLTNVVQLCRAGLSRAADGESVAPLRNLAAWAYNQRGELHAERGRAAEAMADFEAALELNPQSAMALHNRAVTLAEQNQPLEALRDLNRVLELNPGLAVAYRNRGELLASLGRTDDATLDYSRALELRPDDAKLYVMRAHAYQRLGLHDAAMQDLDRAIRLAPDQAAEAHVIRANIHAEVGHFDRAREDFRRALELDEGNRDAYRGLAWLLATCPDERFRNPEMAMWAARQAARLSDADDCFVLDTLAAALASAGRFDEAARWQQQAVAVAPGELAEPFRERLDLYAHGRPFRDGPLASAIRTVSHEEPAADQTSESAAGK